MYGAIIGDIIGSYYEVLEIEHQKKYHKPRSYDERIEIMTDELFTENSSYTDDTVLTIAIADAIINGHCQYEKYLIQYGLKEIEFGLDKYGRSRFGKGFIEWLIGNKEGNSFGNGAAMRISPVGYFNTLESVKENSYYATIPSHNNIEAIKGAECVATSIYLLRNGLSKEDLKKYIEKNYYNINYNLEDLRKNNKFSSKCSVTVPQAIYVFLESNSFEDSIRKAISIGGDADTIAAIVGSVSEAYYEIPDYLIEEANKYITDDMKKVINSFYKNKAKVKQYKNSGS